MRPATYQRVQEHLSSEGIFLMGDAQQQGFPIRYASPGFEQAYGYRGQEIVGRKCGDLIGGPMVLNNTTILANAAAASGATLKDAEAKLRFLVEKAGEACRVMMSNPGERVGVALLLNRRKTGVLFVCECLVLNLQHPTLHWSYCVGFQRDITKEVSIPALFAACSSGEYSRLLQSRAQALEARRSTLLGVGSENVVQYLHEKALSVFSLDIWRTLRTELLGSGLGSPTRPAASGSGDAAGAAAAVAQAPAPAEAAAVPPTPESQQLSLPQPAPRGKPAPAAAAGGQQPPGVLSLLRQGSCSNGQLAAQPGGPLAAQPGGPQAAAAAAAGPGAPEDPRWQLMQSNSAVAFLTETGLFQYAEAMLLNGFDDLEALLHMDDEDIRAVGLARGHASRLKRRLREFKCLQICAASGSERRGGARQRSPSPVGSSACSDSPESNRQARTAAERSWERVRRVGVELVGEAMMRTFFELSAEADALFSPEVCARHWDWDAAGARPTAAACRAAALQKMSAKILNVVGNAVAGQHDQRQLVPMLVQLGARHGGYGAREEHFALLGKALLRTLRGVLGDEDFPPEAERAWDMAYAFVSAAMLGGARGSVRLAAPAEAGAAPEAPQKQPPAPAPAPAPAPPSGAPPTLLQQLHGGPRDAKAPRADLAA